MSLDSSASSAAHDTVGLTDSSSSSGDGTDSHITRLYERARSIQVKMDRRQKVTLITTPRSEIAATEGRRQAIYMAVQSLNPGLPSELACPFSGLACVEKTHLLSPTPSRDYRSKLWLKMLGFSDYLSEPDKLAEIHNTWPIDTRFHWLSSKGDQPRALLIPTLSTCVEAIRLTEMAATKAETDPTFRPREEAYLEGWSDVLSFNGQTHHIFQYDLGLFLSNYKLKATGSGIRRQGCGTQFLGVSSDAEWPSVIDPAIPTARLSLSLTHCQLMLTNWAAKGLGSSGRPLSSDFQAILQLSDYRLAIMESSTSTKWRQLPRPHLPFPRPSGDGVVSAIPRVYTHDRRTSSTDTDNPKEPPPYSSSPPPDYRTLRSGMTATSDQEDEYTYQHDDDDWEAKTEIHEIENELVKLIESTEVRRGADAKIELLLKELKNKRTDLEEAMLDRELEENQLRIRLWEDRVEEGSAEWEAMVAAWVEGEEI